MSFERVSAVRRSNEATWTAEVAPWWDILGDADGGYTMAIAARAAADRPSGPPRSLWPLTT